MQEQIVLNGRFTVHRVTGMQRYAIEVRKRLRIPVRTIAPGSQMKGIAGHLWEQSVLPVRSANKMLWSPCNTGPIGFSNQVVTVHDIFPIDHPEWFTRQFAALYAFLLPQLTQRVRHIIAVSQYTKKRLMARFSLADEKITVIPQGVGDEFSPRPPEVIEALRVTLGIPNEPYVLSVGSLEPRKNLSTLLAAWPRVLRAHPEANLVVTGASGRSAVFKRAALSGVRTNVIFPGYVPDQDLPTLYSGAACFVYPSLEEGFGLPVLEALACGTPVVASNLSAIPEIAGPHSHLVDPRSTDEIAAAICRVLDSSTSPQRHSPARQEYAKQYSWDRCAAATERLLVCFS